MSNAYFHIYQFTDKMIDAVSIFHTFYYSCIYIDKILLSHTFVEVLCYKLSSQVECKIWAPEEKTDSLFLYLIQST